MIKSNKFWVGLFYIWSIAAAVIYWQLLAMLLLLMLAFVKVESTVLLFLAFLCLVALWIFSLMVSPALGVTVPIIFHMINRTKITNV